MRMFRWTATIALATTLTLAGCSDLQGPTGPVVDQVQYRPFFSYEPAPGFDVLRRKDPLAQGVSGSALIGPNGGSIALASAGMTLVVPPFAVANEVQITVTAIGGYEVAFEFAPHGLYFAIPPEIRIAVEGTQADSWWYRLWLSTRDDVPADDAVAPGEEPFAAQYLGVYYEGDPDAGVAPLENIPAFLDRDEIVFPILHFSGYACASG